MNCTTNNGCNTNEAQRAAEARTARATPACDVWDTNDGVHVVAEMPGVDPASVEVTVERNVLSIRGQATPMRASPTMTLEYVRQFQLTDTADADGIQASCKDGLVSVLVPRKQPAQRKIAVSVG